uniref:Uncharacterized protein n=1 Tax=Anopheles culicifacies TaxID=139723 RepID=A0A182M0B8_9DIPT
MAKKSKPQLPKSAKKTDVHHDSLPARRYPHPLVPILSYEITVVLSIGRFRATPRSGLRAGYPPTLIATIPTIAVAIVRAVLNAVLSVELLLLLLLLLLLMMLELLLMMLHLWCPAYPPRPPLLCLRAVIIGLSLEDDARYLPPLNGTDSGQGAGGLAGSKPISSENSWFTLR